MTRGLANLVALLGLLASGVCQADEPVIGGPCEGCENVFVGLPEHLTWSARVAPVGEPGEPMVMEGPVRSLDGSPATIKGGNDQVWILNLERSTLTPLTARWNEPHATWSGLMRRTSVLMA